MMTRNKNLCIPNVASVNLLLVVGWVYVIHDAWQSSAMATWSMLWVASVSALWAVYLHRQICRVEQKHIRMLADKEKILRQTLIEREQLIATIGHGLRTPMNAILGFNNLLLARIKNPDALKILNHTQQSAEHLLTVMQDVADASQLQTGHVQIKAETFALRDTVQAAFELFELRAQSLQLTYRCDMADDVPLWVCADKHRLMQILVNLLGNAIKFTHQGHVVLEVRKQEDGVYFAVKDTGIGMAQSQQAQIFQRFQQANTEIQSRYGGYGLGLSITQRLVALMGGRIGFESRLGQGATFWFTLPWRETAAPTATLSDAYSDAPTPQTPPTFLVVDDHDINRMLACQILKSRWSGCQVFEADSGRKALEVLRTHSVDVVLMDMVMPEMDGIETVRLLRHSEASWKDVPVLGLTANVLPQDLESFRATGVNAILLKPFDIQQVCTQVSHMLTAKKSFLGS